MIKHPFFQGAVLDDPCIAIEHDGFHCPSGDFESAGPHSLWCVTCVYPEWLQLAAASWEPVADDGALVLNPKRAVTSAGKVIYVMTAFTVMRPRLAVVPPNHFEIPSDIILPFAFQKVINENVLRQLPPELPENVDWSAERLIKSVLFDRWSNGTKGTLPVTVRDCAERLVDDGNSQYNPPYDGDFEPERQRLIAHFEQAICEHGPDFHARQLLAD